MQLTTIGNFVVVDIHKPFNKPGKYDYDFCRVRKTYFDRAKKSGRYVLVRTPNGERQILPKLFMKKAKAIPEVMLYPDNPMMMYEVMVPHCEKKDEDYYAFK